MQVLSGEDETGNDHTNWREDIFQGMQVQQVRRAKKNAKATPSPHSTPLIENMY